MALGFASRVLRLIASRNTGQVYIFKGLDILFFRSDLQQDIVMVVYRSYFSPPVPKCALFWKRWLEYLAVTLKQCWKEHKQKKFWNGSLVEIIQTINVIKLLFSTISKEFLMLLLNVKMLIQIYLFKTMRTNILAKKDFSI